MTQQILDKPARRAILHRLIVDYAKLQAGSFLHGYWILNRRYWSQHMAEVRRDLDIEAEEWHILTDYKIVPTVSAVQLRLNVNHRGWRRLAETPFKQLPDVLHQAFQDPGIGLLGKGAPMQPADDMRSFALTLHSPSGPVAWIKNMEYLPAGNSVAEQASSLADMWF